MLAEECFVRKVTVFLILSVKWIDVGMVRCDEVVIGYVRKEFLDFSVNVGCVE